MSTENAERTNDWSSLSGLVEEKLAHHTAAVAALTKLRTAGNTRHETNLVVMRLRGELAGAVQELETDDALLAAAHSGALAFLTVDPEPVVEEKTDAPVVEQKTEPATA